MDNIIGLLIGTVGVKRILKENSTSNYSLIAYNVGSGLEEPIISVARSIDGVIYDIANLTRVAEHQIITSRPLSAYAKFNTFRINDKRAQRIAKRYYAEFEVYCYRSQQETIKI